MNLKKIFEYALARERQGRDFFREHAARMSHAAAAAAFNSLANEEENHIVYIERILKHLDGAEQDGQEVDLQEANLFADRTGKELLDQCIIEAMIPDVAVLRTAYLIERDFVEFYERSARSAEGAAKSALNNLAAWERSHEILFKELHDRVFEEYAQMPWGG